MMTAYTTSPPGLALIQDFEGFRAEPGQLPDGGWVVGHGHVRAEAGEPVTEADAANLLSMDLAPTEGMVNANVTQPLTQAQFDALVSFAFSVGDAAFQQSQVLRRVNAGDLLAAACAMDAWRKSDVSGKLEVVDALVRRRAAEKAMFLKNMPCEAAPSAYVRAKLDHAASILGAPIKYASLPALGSASVANPTIESAAELMETLKSEPATEELLLTQVVANDVDAVEQIVTAHATPAARKPYETTAAGSARSSENLGLMTLLLFGFALIGVGVSILLQGHADGVALLGASSLCAPGIAAVLLATYGFLRLRRAKAHAA